jgi:hypothetical protein
LKNKAFWLYLDMEKVVQKFKLKEEPDEMLFWMQKTPEERLAGLEQIRQHHITIFYDGLNPRFQRVYRAFKRK